MIGGQQHFAVEPFGGQYRGPKSPDGLANNLANTRFAQVEPVTDFA
jgi:hypothetical protein